MLALGFVVLTAPQVVALPTDFDARLHGVALDDFDSEVARSLDAMLRKQPPGPLTEVHRVVLGPIASDTDVFDNSPDACRSARWHFDVLGHTIARRKGSRLPHKPLPAHPKPGTPGHRDMTHVVRVAIELPAPDTRCPFPTEPIVEVVDVFEINTLNPFIQVSIADRVVLLEDPIRNFRRVFPAGVGAIDHLRRPGHVTSLTPATDHSRIHPESSFRTLGAPRWFAREPFLPIEAPMVVGNRIGFYTTRLAFHIFQTWRFMRGFVSRGCVTLRTGDLREIRDALFSRDSAIPVFIQAEPMPEVYHPYPHEDAMHFVLKPFGPPERPSWRVSGNLYVTEKVLGAPPSASSLIGVYLDSEARIQARSALANGTAAPASGHQRQRL